MCAAYTLKNVLTIFAIHICFTNLCMLSHLVTGFYVLNGILTYQRLSNGMVILVVQVQVYIVYMYNIGFYRIFIR